MVDTNHYYFIGIKGTGMSALAHILYDEGHHVRGSDVEKDYFTQYPLIEKGIEILPFSANNLKASETVIVGNAFDDTHEEVQRAKELGLDVIRYPDFLAQMMQQYASVGVAGTHGKTSTTGMLAHVLSHLAPTNYLIGDGTGNGAAQSEYFVFEACEYRGHFLSYSPDYTIITNIEYDHPDFFKNKAHLMETFQAYVNQVRKGVVAWGDQAELHELDVPSTVYYYGKSKENDFVVSNIQLTTQGATFTVSYDNQVLGEFCITTLGEHNVLNACGTIAVLTLMGYSPEQIQTHLLTYPGVKRRFDIHSVGEYVTVDDYAHHPTEIAVTIKAARQKYPDKKIVTVFQPHTFSRTKALLAEFAQALNDSDDVWLVDIYNAKRATDDSAEAVKIEDLAQLITPFKGYLTFEAYDELKEYGSDAVLLFLGAGDINQLSESHRKMLQAEQG